MPKRSSEESAIKRLKESSPKHVVQKALADGARKGWVNLLDHVLQLGADPNESYGGVLPLNHASMIGKKEQPEAVERLLKAGGNPNLPGVIRLCGVVSLPLLVRAEGSPDGTGPDDRPLIYAITSYTKPDKAVALLREGANPNLPDGDGRLPLLLAARKGQAPVVRELLERGADSFAVTPDGRSALRLAAEGATGLGWAFAASSKQDALRVVKLLSEHALPSNPEDMLLAVLAQDDAKELRRLIEERLIAPRSELSGAMGTGVHPDPTQILRDMQEEGSTHVDLVQGLISRSREANPSTTVLAWAVALDARRCCSVLLKKGAQFTLPEVSGVTPLDIAKRLRRREILALFEKTSR